MSEPTWTVGQRAYYRGYQGNAHVTVLKVGRAKIRLRFDDDRGPYLKGHEGWFDTHTVTPLARERGEAP